MATEKIIFKEKKIMSFSVSKNSSTSVPSLVSGVTATVTIGNSSAMKVKVNNSCSDINEKSIFTPGEVLTLTNGAYTRNYSYDLNCGSYNGQATLTVQNGVLQCSVTENNNFRKSFITGTVEGSLIFDVTQNKKTLTITQPANSEITVKRNNIELSNGAVIGVGDKLEISAKTSNSTYQINGLIINGTTYNTSSKEITVTGNTTVSVDVGAWHTVYSGSGITVNSGSSYSLSNLRGGVLTEVTMTGYIDSIFITSECGDWAESVGISKTWTNHQTTSTSWTVSDNGYTYVAGLDFPYTASATCSFSGGSISVSTSASGGNEYGSCSSGNARFVITSIKQYY